MQFKYERLLILCYKCGIIEQEQNHCDALQEVVSNDEGKSIPLFRPCLQSNCFIKDYFEGAKLGDAK